MEQFRNILLTLLGLSIALLLSLYYHLPLLDPPNTARHLIVYSACSVLYLSASYLAKDMDNTSQLATIILSALIFRSILLPLDPSMSDDIYRYIWDGRLQLHGINPYLYPANHPELSHLRDWIVFTSMNHPHTHTPYPPTAQIFFFLGTIIEPSGFIGFKIVLLTAELASIPLFLKLLKLYSIPRGRVLWYLWSPLVLFEVSLDGHLDALALPFLALFLLSIRRKAILSSAILWALLCTIKPITVWWFPVFALALWGNWTKRVIFLLLSGLTMFFVTLPYFSAGSLLLKQMLNYAEHWYFNGFFYTILDPLLPQKLNRLTLTLSIASASFIAALAKNLRPEKRLFIPVASYLIISPTLYPWYLLWLYPWLLINPRPWLWWLLSFTYFAHAVHISNIELMIWVPPVWASSIQFLPLFTIIIFSVRSEITNHIKAINGVRKCLKFFSEKFSELFYYYWYYLRRLVQSRQIVRQKGLKERENFQRGRFIETI